MKKTIKRILSSLLVFVFLIGIAPLYETSSGVFTTKASALETVSGSYDYLVKYIKKNSKKNTVYKTYKQGSSKFTNALSYVSDKDYIVCLFSMETSTGTTSFSFNISKSDSKSFAVAEHETKKGKDEAHVSFNPKDYKSGASLNYSFTSQISKSKDYVKELKKLFNSAAERAIGDIDEMLFDCVGFGLGNFGFTKISKATPIPKQNFFSKILIFFKKIFAFFGIK